MRNRGRFQAQGNTTEKSSPWATNDNVYKQTGIDLIDNLQNQLTQNELNERNVAVQKARNFINASSPDGVLPMKKSFFNNIQTRSIRIDIEVNAGLAFLNNPI